MERDTARFWPAMGPIIILLLAAYAVANGPAARLHNADSLIPVFVSLESWTLFYWARTASACFCRCCHA